MKTILKGSLTLLALVLPGLASSAESGSAMWGCAVMGERGNVLYLADKGSRSYINFSGQRIPATLTSNESEKRWAWGANAMVLATDGFVRYYEGDTVKAQFKCKKME